MQDRALKREAVWAPQCSGGRTWRLFRKDCGIRAEIDLFPCFSPCIPLSPHSFGLNLSRYSDSEFDYT